MSDMAWQTLLNGLGPEVSDPEEGMIYQTFLLFSRDIPSQDLGFVDSKAASLDVAVAGKDYVIHQSPAVLSSNRAGGTTGAVLWKVTPIFAEWITSPENPLWKSGVLAASSTVIELGCGISGLAGMALAPYVNKYVLTDQSYVSKYVESNLRENEENARPAGNSSRRKGKGHAAASKANLNFTPLDWELDEVTPHLAGGGDGHRSFDVVVACDCIYNDALIRPLVDTCAAVCKLRPSDEAAAERGPAVCVVAQQLRDPEIFAGWLGEFHRRFRTWRVPEPALSDALRANVGFAIHVGILRE